MKRVWSMILALVLVVGLAACGGGEGTESPAASSTGSSAPAAEQIGTAEAEKPEETTQPEEPEKPAEPAKPEGPVLPNAQSFSGNRLEVNKRTVKEGYVTVIYKNDQRKAFLEEYLNLLQSAYPFALRTSGDYGSDATAYCLDYTGEGEVKGFPVSLKDKGKAEDVEVMLLLRTSGITVKYGTGLQYIDAGERTSLELENRNYEPEEGWEDPKPAQPVVIDSTTIPSAQSFSKSRMEVEKTIVKDNYTSIVYMGEYNDFFTQEYLKLLQEKYSFELRTSGDYGSDATAYCLDYTGDGEVSSFKVSLKDKASPEDVEVMVLQRTSGVSVKYASGLNYVDTGDRTTQDMLNHNPDLKAASGKVVDQGSGGSSGSSSGSSSRRCATCGGDGEVDCHSCSGSGEKDCVSCSGKGYIGRYVSVPNYSGTGTTSKLEKERCSSCGGDGEEDCYACRGSGEKKCTSCGGDGEK